MIRFIDLGKQIGLDEEWSRQFAFFNTIPDKFLEIGGDHVWDSFAELDDSLRIECKNTFEGNLAYKYWMDRLKPLCPLWVFEGGKL